MQTKSLNASQKTHVIKLQLPEAALQRCSKEKVSWQYAVNLEENTHAEVWFQ